jgi:hypothetical protein
MGTRWQRVMWGGWTAWEKVFPIEDSNLPLRLKGAASAGPITDCNTANQSGFYYVNPNSTNGPPGGADGYLYVAAHSGAYCRQVFENVHDMSAYVRMQDGGVWGPWCIIRKSVLNATTVRRTISGMASGTLDGNGTARINFGKTVSNVASLNVTNNHTSKLNGLYSAVNIDTSGFTLYAWGVTNVPDANGVYTISWIATVDDSA